MPKEKRKLKQGVDQQETYFFFLSHPIKISTPYDAHKMSNDDI